MGESPGLRNGIANFGKISKPRSRRPLHNLLFLWRGNIKLEMNDVSILDHISLPLLSELSSSFDRTQRFAAFAEIMEILISDDLSFDETALEIAMDNASSLWRKSASLHNPTANFFLARYLRLAKIS